MRASARARVCMFANLTQWQQLSIFWYTQRAEDLCHATSCVYTLQHTLLYRLNGKPITAYDAWKCATGNIAISLEEGPTFAPRKKCVAYIEKLRMRSTCFFSSTVAFMQAEHVFMQECELCRPLKLANTLWLRFTNPAMPGIFQPLTDLK